MSIILATFKKSSPVQFRFNGHYIQGIINSVYLNVCASVKGWDNKTYVVALEDLRPHTYPSNGSRVQFHNENKWHEGTVTNIVNNEIATVLVNDEKMFIRLIDLKVL